MVFRLKAKEGLHGMHVAEVQEKHAKHVAALHEKHQVRLTEL